MSEALKVISSKGGRKVSAKAHKVPKDSFMGFILLRHLKIRDLQAKVSAAHHTETLYPWLFLNSVDPLPNILRARFVFIDPLPNSQLISYPLPYRGTNIIIHIPFYLFSLWLHSSAGVFSTTFVQLSGPSPSTQQVSPCNMTANKSQIGQVASLITATSSRLQLTSSELE